MAHHTRNIVPRQTMGSARTTHLGIPKRNSTNASLRDTSTQQTNPHNKQRHHTSITRQLKNLRRSPPPNQHRRNRNTLNPIGCRHGHVPWRRPSLCHPNDRPMVERLIHEIHSQTNRRIYLRHLATNAYHARLPPRPQQRTNIVASANRIWRVGFADAASKRRGKWTDIIFSATRDRARGDHLLITWSKSQHSHLIHHLHIITYSCHVSFHVYTLHLDEVALELNR